MRDIALDREGYQRFTQEQEMHKKSMSTPNSRPNTSYSRSDQEYPGTPIGIFISSFLFYFKLFIIIYSLFLFISIL